ncbi:hypothetical protein CAPTEDRAFT_201698 [Capitella teleta]|uniref:Uncharacterized protein n=1 Tax=Capitella teleta TaxID=283909 RepID=R7V1L0_CAPTE|nr:hypothetical protein CAPTEDRAFT_201698 [Capitella teleta]|eukprot:ELU10196.1 hypothetical protein CAPTEDRAFT_201698 [Capitella teleta]
MSKIKEHGRDDTVVSDLCKKMDFCSRPTEVKRLGKKTTNDNYRLLLKVTFSSVFASGVFRSRFNEMKKEYETLRRISLRPGRTKEEHEEYKNSVTIANKLNDEANKSENNTSYSVRDNGAVWKYEKNNDGKWSRVADWKLPSENYQRGPKKQNLTNTSAQH